MGILLGSAKIDSAVMLEAHELYVKQTYRNRAYILGPHQVEILTVPVVGGTKKIKIQDIKIDKNQNWQRLHWRSLKSCYGRSPFWEHYAPMLKPLFTQNFTFLWELNHQVLATCLQLLSAASWATYKQTTTYTKDVIPSCLDLRHSFRPSRVPAQKKLYFSVGYVQVFGANFVENLSVLDVLFCQGPQASAIIRQSFRPSANI